MKRYMLDTITASHLIKEHPGVVKQVKKTPLTSLCISAITEGELLFGLAKRPQAIKLHAAVKELLRCIDILPWNSAAAARYALIRAQMEAQGKVLSPLDLLIGTHALAVNAVLVSNDKAFRKLEHLSVEDWTTL